MSVPDETTITPATETCAQCGTSLTAGDRVPSGDRVFCRSCYEGLRAELESAVQAMSSDVNYVNAAAGAVLGGAIGALAWWGFTVLTKFSLGLVAIVIGYLTGFFAVKFAGDKRSTGLQALSVTVALVSYVVATYLVNMTFANQALAQQGETFRVAFPPQNFDLFVRVLSFGFGVMDVVFLAIVVYEAWRIPKPLSLPPRSA